MYCRFPSDDHARVRHSVRQNDVNRVGRLFDARISIDKRPSTALITIACTSTHVLTICHRQDLRKLPVCMGAVSSVTYVLGGIQHEVPGENAEIDEGGRVVGQW